MSLKLLPRAPQFFLLESLPGAVPTPRHGIQVRVRNDLESEDKWRRLCSDDEFIAALYLDSSTGSITSDPRTSHERSARTASVYEKELIVCVLNCEVFTRNM